jgi:hypothetical protein
MPPPPAGFHAGNPPFLYLRRKDQTEPMPPESNSLRADIDAAFVQQIFHIAKGQREPDIQHHGKTNDVQTGFEVAEC